MAKSARHFLSWSLFSILLILPSFGFLRVCTWRGLQGPRKQAPRGPETGGLVPVGVMVPLRPCDLSLFGLVPGTFVFSLCQVETKLGREVRPSWWLPLGEMVKRPRIKSECDCAKGEASGNPQVVDSRETTAASSEGASQCYRAGVPSPRAMDRYRSVAC